MTRTLAVAGIVGPVLFTVGFLVLGLVRRGEYDPVAQQISDLTAGRYGWAQQLNFVVFGLLMIAFAVGLQQGVRATRARVVGRLVLAVWLPCIVVLALRSRRVATERFP
jgi:hypothetical membrane protein